MEIIFIILLVTGGFILANQIKKGERRKGPIHPLPDKCRKILLEKVAFYRTLSPVEKERFEYEVQEFLMDCKITGVETEVTTTDRMLVAASAIIPVFAFPEWKYYNLQEVLLYPARFNPDFKPAAADSNILGMVGTGYMEGMMILSKPALHHGFSNNSDKKNTAIHEFVHLIDKMDGSIDGVPELLLEQPYVIPWLNLIDQKIAAIYQEKSDINPYGGTNAAEFYAVVCEYFFERPRLLSRKHPKLYHMLEEIFEQDMAARQPRKLKRNIGRNSRCPCQSGRKYKHCCGKA